MNSIGVIILLAICIIVVWMGCRASYDDGDKSGQIAAINGVFKYILIETLYGERLYIKRKDLKHYKDAKVIIDPSDKIVEDEEVKS